MDIASLSALRVLCRVRAGAHIRRYVGFTGAFPVWLLDFRARAGRKRRPYRPFHRPAAGIACRHDLPHREPDFQGRRLARRQCGNEPPPLCTPCGEYPRPYPHADRAARLVGARRFGRCRLGGSDRAGRGLADALPRRSAGYSAPHARVDLPRRQNRRRPQAPVGDAARRTCVVVYVRTFFPEIEKLRCTCRLRGRASPRTACPFRGAIRSLSLLGSRSCLSPPIRSLLLLGSRSCPFPPIRFARPIRVSRPMSRVRLESLSICR